MYKKRILGLAIASALTLTGCLESNQPADELNTGANHSPDVTTDVPTVAEGAVYPIFNPGESQLPIPNDLIYQAENEATGARADGTYKVFSSNPATAALNELSGASTIAPIDIAMSGEILPASVIKNATVFMFALEYASDNPLQGLSIGEVPTIIPGDQPDFDVSVESYSGTNNTIRITPTTPLLPNKRYVVAVTNNILSSTGENIVRSPGLAGYGYLTNPENPLASSALASVVSLIDFWERIVATATGGAVPAENVAMSYSFTTSRDEKVLHYIADPAQWVTDTIRSTVKLETVKATIASLTQNEQEVTHAALDAQVTNQVNAFMAAGFNPLLAGACSGQTPDIPAGEAQLTCAGRALVQALESGSLGLPAGSYFPTPASATTSFATGAGEILDINLVSALTASLNIAPGTVSVSQGTIELPYYLEAADGANGAPLITGNWEANDTLATILNGIVGDADGETEAERRPFAQHDPALSTAVTANFPFPKLNSTETAPVLAIFPSNPANPGTPMKTVIFQHGITTDRSAALAFGASVVAGARAGGTDVAVIAIDQPLHGIDGISQAEQAALAEQLLSAAALGQIADGDTPTITPDGTIDGTDADPADQAVINAVVAGQFSTLALSQVPQPTGCTFVDNLDLSSSSNVLIALGGISNGACNADLGLGAAALADGLTSVLSAQTLERTVANGGSTIPGLGQGSDSERHFGFTAGAPQQPPVAMDFTGSSADNRSGSMFINLSNFLGSRDNLRQGVVDLLTLRHSLGGMDINGGGAGDLDTDDVYFVGHSLGTIGGIPFAAVTDMSATTEDNLTAANMLTPGGGLTRLAENSPSFAPSIIAGLAGLTLTQDTASYQTFLNVLQATVDSGDSINFADKLSNTPTLLSLVIGDQVIPNEITDADDGSNADGNEFNDTLSKADIGTLLSAATAAGDARNIAILTAVLNLPGNSSVAPLSGTEPLATQAGAGVINDAAGPQALTRNIVRYTEGGHETPVFPSSGTNEESAAFAEMVAQTVSILATNGAAVVVDNSVIDVIQ